MVGRRWHPYVTEIELRGLVGKPDSDIGGETDLKHLAAGLGELGFRDENIGIDRTT
jgi:hypothetical protein